MMSLTEYRRRPALLADWLPWAGLVAPGVVLNKDGAFQRTARFRGPDLDSATPGELVATSARLNNALRRLGSGWALFVEAERRPAADYPESSFPEPLSWMVDEERRAAFEEASSHFESRYHLTLLYLPPEESRARAGRLLYENQTTDGADGPDWRARLGAFVAETERIFGLLEGVMPEIAWLDDGQSLTYLHACISTRVHPVAVPEVPMHLDALLADEPLVGGLAPMLGAAHLRVLTVRGFPTSTWPGLLDELNRLGFAYRWSTRFICLDKSEAEKALAPEPGVSTLADLVRATLRLRPDRIIVGEVRGAEALDLLKAWGTGHPGGIATVHAGSAAGALTRLEQLVQEVSVTVPRALIAETVNVVVFIAGRGRARRVREIARVIGFDSHGYRLDTSPGSPSPSTSSTAATASTSSPSSTTGEPS